MSPTPSRIVFSTSWNPFARWRLSSRPARTGPCFFDLLQGSGIHFVLAHAKRLRAIADSTYKRDEVDAELLARMPLAGLILNRAMLVRQRTAAAARIHSQLHQVGLHMARGHLLTQDGRQWVRSEAWPLMGPERMGRAIPAVSLLRTVPGIGPYRALLIATETMPIERFSKPAHLVSYAGLAPHRRSWDVPASGTKPE